MRPIITLTTDFGTRDGYVGIMKGVMLSICPDGQCIDITHEIPPQNITAAALVLESASPFFPPGTVHLVVVDPGVGTNRRPLALITPSACYVGPDNGVLSLVWRAARHCWSPDEIRAVELNEPSFWLPQISATFHGRDIFAPVAAHLACGVASERLGTPLTNLTMLPLEEPAWEGPERLCGRVLFVDHFGNGVTSLTRDHLERLTPPSDHPFPSGLRVTVGEAGSPTAPHLPLCLPVRTTYADVAPGEAVALIGGTGRLEIAQCNGNAAAPGG
ncbi:MAG: SAM-dependent chlorinase/fluorinase [Chloroflexaceae bacterium]|nr:SAM-dependent chlorinase/fluorinase [Chloroflexaceae bacterium]